MPRSPRIIIPGLPHHIVFRGNNRRRLFTNDSDRLSWLRCLEEGIEATHVAMHQHTLMTNHIHLMSTPSDEDAFAKMAKRACQRYAQIRNEKWNATGKLFEQRYYVKVITDETQLLNTLFYNDANAYRAGQSADPTAHAWSTGPLHAGRSESKIPRSMWTPHDFYTRLGRTPEARAAEYRRLLAAYLHEPTWIPYDDSHFDEKYRKRIERPDGSSAREPLTHWGRRRE